MKRSVIPLAFIVLTCPHLVMCAGYMTIEFLRYSSGGFTVSGKACDNDTGSVFYDPCDPQFRLTADKLVANGSAEYSYQQINYYSNQDDVTFGSTFGQVTNPVVIGMNYDNNMGQLWIQVHVVDIDGQNSEPMSKFSALLKASGTETTHLELTNELSRLTLTYRYTCNSNYYGLLCNTYCRVSNSDEFGHSWCTSSGEKVCLYGWVEPRTDCKKPHPCRTCVCQNGGTCVPQGEGFSCICPADYSGARCENCDPKVSKCSEVTNECGCDLVPIRPCEVAESINRSAYISFIVGFSVCLAGTIFFASLCIWQCRKYVCNPY